MNNPKYKVGDVIIFVSDSDKSVYGLDFTGIVAIIQELPEEARKEGRYDYGLRALNRPFCDNDFEDAAKQDYVEKNTRLFKGNLETLKLLYEKD